MNMYWPLALIVFSNIFYHISSKQIPENVNPLASVIVTYLVGAIFAAILYFSLNKDANLLKEYSHLNWTSFVLGFAIVGLEVGSMYMYKVGWNMNTGYLMHSGIFAITLLFLGYFLYKEQITPTKIAGLLLCLLGLFLIKK